MTDKVGLQFNKNNQSKSIGAIVQERVSVWVPVRRILRAQNACSQTNQLMMSNLLLWAGVCIFNDVRHLNYYWD